MGNTVVIFHRADYDGIFCREIARHFLVDSDPEFIGWDFGDKPLIVAEHIEKIYVMDLPPECLVSIDHNKVVWIDHHKSAIEKWDRQTQTILNGCRIDGVAACRIAWQWFTPPIGRCMPSKEEFLKRAVSEPLAVTLAGEYDVWQHENSGGDDVTFQFGLDASDDLVWKCLLEAAPDAERAIISNTLDRGRWAQQCYAKRDADIVTQRGFDVEFEGLNFRALCTARCNSQTFDAAIKPHHDGCLAFWFDGKSFNFSLYGVFHKPEIDLSKIAVKYGGGGHRSACGFRWPTMPWLTPVIYSKGGDTNG